MKATLGKYSELSTVKVNSSRNINIPVNSKTTYKKAVLMSFEFSFTNESNKIETRKFIGNYNKAANLIEYTYSDINNFKIKYISPQFFSNETDAYNFMWNNTETGAVTNSEQVAFITESGVWVSSNAYSTTGSSVNTLPIIVTNNELYVYGERVLAEVHTHPSFGNPDFHDGDKGSLPALRGSVGFSIAGKGDDGKGMVDGAYWGNNGWVNFVFPTGTTRESLLNGTVKLTKTLKKHAETH